MENREKAAKCFKIPLIDDKQFDAFPRVLPEEKQYKKLSNLLQK